MKILKSFILSVITIAGILLFLWLLFLAICNFTELSNKSAMDITIGITAAVFFSYLLWLFGGFDWVKKLWKKRG